MDSDQFKREYHDLFFGDPKLIEFQRERERRMKPKQKDGRGSLEGFNPEKVAKKPSAEVLAQMAGRMSGYRQAPATPPAETETKTVRPTLTPNDEGTLDLTVE